MKKTKSYFVYYSSYKEDGSLAEVSSFVFESALSPSQTFERVLKDIKNILFGQDVVIERFNQI